MPKTLYDTRFLIEHYYTANKDIQQKTKQEITKTKEKHLSTITIHEVHLLTLKKEGRQTAKLRTTLLQKDFKTTNVNPQIAETSAEIRHKYNIPMADSIIAATAQTLKATLITDDPHLTNIKEIKTKWL